MKFLIKAIRLRKAKTQGADMDANACYLGLVPKQINRAMKTNVNNFSKLVTTAFIALSLSDKLFANDLIVTNGGKEIRARVTSYKDGKITMMDEFGHEQNGSIANISEIRFDVMPRPLVVERGNPTPKEIELNPEKFRGRTFTFEKCRFNQDVDRSKDVYTVYITFHEGTDIFFQIHPALIKAMTKDLAGGYNWFDCKLGLTFSNKEPFLATITSLDVLNAGGRLSLCYRIDEQGNGQRFEAKKDDK
jgi:hypothetical protein